MGNTPAIISSNTSDPGNPPGVPQEGKAGEETAPVTKGPFGTLMHGISRNVVVLSAASFFTDVSREMVVPVRILFLVLVLRTPLMVAGLVEGIAASTPSLINTLARRRADKVSRRKPLILLGYTLSNAAKPMLAVAATWPSALFFIFLDRIGRGVRGSPRDTMMADSTPWQYRGKAFGFHRSMDTLGAAVGPLLTFIILLLTSGDVRAVFWWTALPGLLGVLVILFLRERRKVTNPVESAPAPVSIAEEKKAAPNERVRVRDLGVRFWMLATVAGVFALGNFSVAFIFLKAAELESSVITVPLIYFAYNVVYAILATPLGALSDRWGRLTMLITGYAAFGLVYMGWAFAGQGWHAWALFMTYGICSAATEGVSKAFMTDLVPMEVRDTALGWFNGTTALAALPASIIGGWLWGVAGSPATFMYGAWMSAIAAGLAIAWLPWLRRKPAQERGPELAGAQS